MGEPGRRVRAGLADAPGVPFISPKSAENPTIEFLKAARGMGRHITSGGQNRGCIRWRKWLEISGESSFVKLRQGLGFPKLLFNRFQPVSTCFVKKFMNVMPVVRCRMADGRTLVWQGCTMLDSGFWMCDTTCRVGDRRSDRRQFAGFGDRRSGVIGRQLYHGFTRFHIVSHDFPSCFFKIQIVRAARAIKIKPD